MKAGSWHFAHHEKGRFYMAGILILCQRPACICVCVSVYECLYSTERTTSTYSCEVQAVQIVCISPHQFGGWHNKGTTMKSRGGGEDFPYMPAKCGKSDAQTFLLICLHFSPTLSGFGGTSDILFSWRGEGGSLLLSLWEHNWILSAGRGCQTDNLLTSPDCSHARPKMCGSCLEILTGYSSTASATNSKGRSIFSHKTSQSRFTGDQDRRVFSAELLFSPRYYTLHSHCT